MIRLKRNSLTVVLLVLLGPFSARSQTAQAQSTHIAFVKEWGDIGTEPGKFNFPIGIAINAKDEIFVTDHDNDRVQKFDADGKLLVSFAVQPNPGGMALDESGNLYITHFAASMKTQNKGGDFISVYDPQGKLLRKWGKSGAGDGEFSYPGGLAVSKEGRLYVADQTNHRVQVFDREGKFLFKWGEFGSAPGQFGGKDWQNSRTGGPQFIALDSGGNVWTTEGANGRIQKFTPDGKPLLAWGDNENKPGSFGGIFFGFEASAIKAGQTPPPRGKLQGPIALCFDRRGHLWVSAVCGRIQHFDPDGKYLGGLTNEQGDKPGQFFAPHGLALDGRGNLYVVDSFNHRVQKFATSD